MLKPTDARHVFAHLSWGFHQHGFSSKGYQTQMNPDFVELKPSQAQIQLNLMPLHLL